MIEKHRVQGVNVLANDDAIMGNESELKAQGIEFFPRWQTNPTYRELLRQTLKSDEVYIMKIQGQIWTYVRASEEDYEVLDPTGNTNIRPRTR